MTEPVRLRETGGAARALLSAGKLSVPHASRQRALAFTSAAASFATAGTAAAAGATSLVKSVVMCVCLGTLGGGVASLAVSETVARWQAPPAGARPGAAALAPQSSGRPTPAAVANPAGELESVPAPPVAPVPSVAPAEQPATLPERQRAGTPTGASSASPTLAPAAPAPRAENASSPRVSNLFDEQRVIESARAAVSRGDAPSALATLDYYERSYAHGQFGPEALALRIEALSAKGDLARARSLAAEFRQRHPHHPLLASVQAAVQSAPSKR